MNKTVIKELQKLIALCVEINDKTEYDANLDISGGANTFNLYVMTQDQTPMNADWVAMVNKITLPNINKCRQKLLKYKEW